MLNNLKLAVIFFIMLSETQQKLMLKMYIKLVRTNDSFITRNDVKELYSTRQSFHKGIRYLIDSKFIERVEVKMNVVAFRLTLKGEFIARILCTLHDNPPEIRALKWALRL